jgi:hypothetical protein
MAFNGVHCRHDRTMLILGAVSIASALGVWTGTLDLGGNDIIIRGGNTSNAIVILSTMISQLSSGLNQSGAIWTGKGIVTSRGAADLHSTTGIGYSLNGGSFTSFDGQPIGNADILLKHTYFGDANLSGVVDTTIDYGLLTTGSNNHLTGWSNGDFNYDGIVNSADRTVFENAYAFQGSGL